MSNKITIAILSILTIFFLTAQTCSIPSTSTGIATDCVGEGDVVCDDTEAYECGLASYGTGYYVSRASEFDAEYCGAEEAFDEESLARILISLSSDLEDQIDDLNDLKMQGRNAEADGDGRALVAIRAELSEVRTTLSEIRTVFGDVAAEVVDAAAAGEDTTALDALVTDTETELTVAEDLLLVVSTQVTDALAALSGGGTSALVVADCSVSATTAVVGETITFDGSGSHSAASYLWDFGDGSGTSTDVAPTYTYSYADPFTATLTVTASDGTTDTVDCDTVTVDYCVEIDSGQDWTTQGTTTGTYSGTFGSYDDVCFGDGGTDLSEYYCSGSDVLRVTKDCSYIDASYLCFDGACGVAEVGSDCSTDADCSDNYACDLTTYTCNTYCDFGNAECTSGYACSKTGSTNDGCQLDTDGDALPDDREAVYGSDETDTDTDDDGLSDYDEVMGVSDPTVADSDGDGLNDGIEATVGLSAEDDELSSYELLNFDIDDTATYTITSTSGSVYTVSDFTADGRSGYTDGTVRVYDTSTSSVGQYIGLTDLSYQDVVYFNDAADLDVTDWLVIKAKVDPQTTSASFYPLVIKKEDSSTCTITSAADYGLWISSGKYQFRVQSSGGTSYSATASSTVGSSWQEVIGVLKDETMYLFVDGELVGTGAGPTTLGTSSSGLFVGNLGSGGSCSSYNYHGLIDSFQIWGE